MKIVFFGSPDYVLPILIELNKTFKKADKSPIVAVVTQKPKPVGRKKKVTFSPIDRWAHKRNLPVYYESNDLLKNNVQADVGILAAYGEIIPSEVINSFPNGILNVHPSLLPKHRGASPVQATIATGDKETGVTIIRLDEKLDHGPIVAQFKETVKSTDTTESLRARLFKKSSPVLSELLNPYLEKKVNLKKQDDTKATFTTLLFKNHAFIPLEFLKKESKKDWQIPFIKELSLKPTDEAIERFIRAMQPWPVAWTTIKVGKKEKRLKILKAHLEKKELVIDEVQLEGKNPVSWKQFQQAFGGFKQL